MKALHKVIKRVLRYEIGVFLKNSGFSYLYGSISYLFGYEKNRCFFLMCTRPLFKMPALMSNPYTIGVRPSKQPLMVRTFLKVYMDLGSYFLFLQEQIKDIIITAAPNRN
jgi:hypothetical protein